MYRDDDAARAEQARVLIDEIARLEHQQVTRCAADQRLDAARAELSSLQPRAPAAPTRHGALAHLVVFAATAGIGYLGYSLLG